MNDYMEAKRAILKQKLEGSGLASKAKKCVTCGGFKPRREFALHDTSSDGYASVCNSCRTEKNNERRRTNPVHRLKHHMSVRIERQLGLNCPPEYQKNLEKYLGYRISELVKKLEAELSEEGMSLAEVFKQDWHLDHIKPLHSFNVTRMDSEAFRACWAINNLKFIPAEVNLAKGGKEISHAEARRRVETNRY